MGVVSFDKQVTKAYAVTLAPAGKFPIVGDRIFDTLQAAQNYVDGNAASKTAIPGIYLSVIADGDNNGAYWVAQAAGYDGATSGILQKMGEGGGGTGSGGGIDSIEFSLASNATNAVSLTINGTTKNITAATLKSSLNVLGVSENAASATKLKDNTAYTIWGNTFFSNGKPANVSNHLYMGNGKAIYFADSGGTNRVLCQVNTSNTALFGQGTASAGYDTYLNGHNVYIRTNYGNTIAMTLSSAGKVGIKKSPTYELDVDGQINSTNYMIGGSLNSDPMTSFQTTIFGAKDSTYCKMRIMRKGAATDRFNFGYAPILAMKTFDTHSFISIAYNEASRCHIGGGIGDAISWSAILFNDSMSLIPYQDAVYVIGDSTHRYKGIIVADHIRIGDAIISWDASAGMLKSNKGIYSTGAITAGAK